MAKQKTCEHDKAEVLVMLIPDGDAYEVEVVDKAGLEDHELAQYLRTAADELEPEDRARGMW